jgi:hypothetical protein
VGPEGRLWVEHPVTKILQPIELDPAGARIIQDLESGTIVPRDLPPATLALLLLGQVVVPVAAASPSPLTELRESLVSDKYLVVRNVVSPLFVAAMRRHYRALARAGHLVTDPEQVKGMRDGMYCEFVLLYVQDQLGRWLNGIVPRPMKPSFAFFTRYRPEAVLARHVDREQCLWNVSLAIDADPDPGRADAWPLCFQVGDEARSVRLGLGDAVLYSGVETPHWRDALAAGRTAALLTMHYVDLAFRGALG